jgi:glutamine cyclotransferase
VYDKETFKVLRSFAYSGEGWGLTHDGRRLILSDGTETLRFLDPETFRVTGALRVVDRGTPALDLNELEYVKGEIYANVWRTNRIARISPRNGKVLGWIDLTGLLPFGVDAAAVDVLNGIAYDPAGDRLFVTGKLWPRLFEIVPTGPVR